MEVDGQLHTPAVLLQGKESLVGPKCLSRCGSKEKKNPFSAPAGNRTPVVHPLTATLALK